MGGCAKIRAAALAVFDIQTAEACFHLPKQAAAVCDDLYEEFKFISYCNCVAFGLNFLKCVAIMFRIFLLFHVFIAVVFIIRSNRPCSF